MTLRKGSAAPHVRLARHEDLDRCADVLGAAFADYAWTRWTVDRRDHVDRVRALQRSALERLGMPYGSVWLAEGDDRIEAVAVVMDSEVAIPSEVIAAVMSSRAALEGHRHAASLAADEITATLEPPGRHFVLAAIGTVPARQRRGLASRLLDAMLSTADQDGVPTYLETSAASNVAFYAARGFVVTAECVVPGGGPPVWGMTREPR